MNGRHVAIAALLLIVGAIINIAVAWSCVLLVDIDRADEQYIFTDAMTELGGYLSVAHRTRFGYSQSIKRLVRPSTYGVAGAGHIFQIPQSPPGHRPVRIDPGKTIEQSNPDLFSRLHGGGLPPGTIAYWPWETQAGLPMRSMRCWHENLGGVPSSRSMATIGPVTIRRGFIIGSPTPPQRARALPFEPMWLGFIINTLIYAALIGFLFFGSIRLRRWRRLRRGLCPRCTYPIGVSPVCTECGLTLPNHKPANARAGH
jgi:hypothetical protein